MIFKTYLKTILILCFFILNTLTSYGQLNNKKNPSIIFKSLIDKRPITSNDGYIYKDSKDKKTIFKLSQKFEEDVVNRLNSSANSNKNNPYSLTIIIDSLRFNELNFVGNIVEGTMFFEGQINEIIENPKIILPFKYYLKYKRSLNTTANLNKIFFDKVDDIKQKTITWFNENYGNNLNLVKHLKIVIGDFTPKNQIKDTLYYQQRKLNFDDFILKPKKQIDAQHDLYKMAVLTTFNYQFETSMADDSLIVKLFSKVYQVKNKSYIDDFEKTEYNLKYLQSYFDISQMMAEKFKYSIRKGKFEIETFKSAIDNIYIDQFTEFMEMKDEYELKTNNGFNHEEQEKWHKMILEKTEEYKRK